MELVKKVPPTGDMQPEKALDYLELLSDITGDKVNIFNEPMIKNMGEYISRSYIGNGWVVNFADASARGEGNSYLIYRFGKAVNSEELKGFAALMHQPKSSPNNGRDIFRTLASIAVDKELRQTEPRHETALLPGIPKPSFAISLPKKDYSWQQKEGIMTKAIITRCRNLLGMDEPNTDFNRCRCRHIHPPDIQ